MTDYESTNSRAILDSAAARAAVPLTPGTPGGPYEILERIGSGGMGEVYRAHDPRLNRTVALKALRTEVSSPPSRNTLPVTTSPDGSRFLLPAPGADTPAPALNVILNWQAEMPRIRTGK